MGGTAKYSKAIPLEIYSSASKVILVTDKYEQEITIEKDMSEVPLENVLFAYVKVTKGLGRFKKICAVSNPIYFNQEETK